MAKDRKRNQSYQAPEVIHLQRAVDAVKAALDPKQNRAILAPQLDAQMELEEASEEPTA